ncbi:MAG: ATP-binding protein [Flavobacteriales bacterium]
MREEEKAALEQVLGKPKILMVDDRPENLLALEKLLQDLPVELYKANSGNQALMLTLHHDFALALLDIQMPEMDGYELAEILRSEEKTARVPFIFISAIYTDNIHVFKGYEKGAFSFITKPFEPKVLLSKIDFFIEKYQQEQALKKTHALLEARVKQRTKDLEKSNKELEQFAYVASHDLQEPLRAITSYLQLLQKHNEGELDEKSNRYIEVAVDGAKRMKNLIEGLLAYSRVGTRGKDFELSDFNEIMKKVLADLRISIAENGAQIKVDKLPHLKVDPIQIRLLLQNLVSNGIKFRKKEEKPKIKVTAVEEGDHWHFSVADNGIGIEQEFFERVFVIFQRLHTRHNYQGTGIGLSICKKIVERHNGRIWLESEPSKGTTVHFTLHKSPTN